MRGTMKVNGLTCNLHMPKALKSHRLEDGTEVALGLPPGNLQPAYPVDDYPACPTNWEHGSAKASSYFVGIKAGEGMWLDFNGCREHTHDVAIVVSVQGINSVTGQPTLEGRFYLEQYREKCPKHGCDFQQERFCPECKYKWPAQNYLASTGQPYGQLWLDGFRAADGIVRQYLFSEEEEKGVAYNKLDKDKPKEQQKRVFAIGIAYFLSKEAKPKPTYPQYGTRGFSMTGSAFGMTKGIAPASAGFESYGVTTDSVQHEGTACSHLSDSVLESMVSFNAPVGASGVTPTSSDTPLFRSARASLKMDDESRTSARLVDRIQKQFTLERPVEQVTVTKNYEVAAGARINQKVHADPKDLSHWNEEPAGMIYINYCGVEDLQRILAAGRRAESTEGFLSDVVTGN